MILSGESESWTPFPAFGNCGGPLILARVRSLTGVVGLGEAKGTVSTTDPLMSEFDVIYITGNVYGEL